MKINITRFKLCLFAVIVLAVGIATDGRARAVGQVTASPSNFSLAEGSSRSVDISLDEPIICPPEATQCQVSLTFTSSDPNYTIASPIPLVFDPSEWSTTKPLTITSNNDNLATGDKAVTLSAVAASDSEYYKNYSVSISVNVIDAGVAATPQPTAKPVIYRAVTTPQPTAEPTATPTTLPTAVPTVKITNTPVATAGPVYESPRSNRTAYLIGVPIGGSLLVAAGYLAYIKLGLRSKTKAGHRRRHRARRRR